MGGLGNQMFQYAAARALADRHHTDVVVDLSWFLQEFGEHTTLRIYELDAFALDKQVRKRKNPRRRRWYRSWFTRYQEPYFDYKEPHYHYDPHFEKLPKKTALSGYFQSERYFYAVDARVREDFRWKQPACGENERIWREICGTRESVAIHVRRGDYTTLPTVARFHGFLGVAYYQEAVKYLVAQIRHPKFYVFSDDIPWCQRELRFSQPTHYVSHNREGVEDLRLMSACHHQILANSTFSWWGAWLNTHQDKIVVAPKRWFVDETICTEDLIPPSWQRC